MPVSRSLPAALLVLLVLCVPGGVAQEGSADLQRARQLEQQVQKTLANVRDAVITVGVHGRAAHASKLRSGGSGVVISADGWALTCEHVTEGRREVLVGLPDGRTVDGTVVGRDVLGDLAVIKLPVEGHPFVSLGDSSRLRVGDWVLALGNPFGLARSDHTAAATLGIISALHRYQAGSKVYGDALQIDAAVNPGNSGGPLFDLSGNLVGLNGRISIRGVARHNVGVGFAIPAHQIRLVLETLKQGKDVTRGYLGVRFYTQVDGRPGVRVSQVVPGSPAQKGGLRPGDRILRVGERVLDHPVRLQNYLSVFPAGTEVTLRVQRGGRTFDAKVTLAPRPEAGR